MKTLIYILKDFQIMRKTLTYLNFYRDGGKLKKYKFIKKIKEIHELESLDLIH